MVRLLIRMRATMLAHQGSTRFGTVSAIAGGLFGLFSALTSFALGFADYPTAAAGSDVIATVMLVWIVGRVAYAAFTGGGATLRFEIFRLLPIPRPKLARSLLIVGLIDPALVFMALAFSSLVVLGARQSVGAALIGVAGALLALLLTGVLVSMAGALLPSGSRRRHDFGTMVVAIVISLVAIAATLLPSLAAALTSGHLPALSAVVRILPSGWAAVAVDGARNGNALIALLPLIGLLVLTAALIVAWPRLLSRRLDGTVGASAGGRSRRPGRRILPQTPTGAVIAKEVRLWFRDPVRVTLLMIAVIVGLGVSVIPEITHGTSALLPFAGPLTIVIAGAAGCNLYGLDGLALRLTVLTPGSERADIRGRQLAWLLLVGPYAAAISVILTLVSGQGWAWPWILGLLPALLGGALGLIPLASVIGVQTLDDNGGLTPGWPLKLYIVLILIVVGALPTVALLLVGTITQVLWLEWLAVPLGIATGTLLAVALGRLATRHFRTHELDILAVLTAASSPA